MSGYRIAVVGGGLAGLAAAARLRVLGFEPVIFERQQQAGGVVRTDCRDGWIIDSGPCMAAEPDPDVRALLDRAGLAPLTVRAHSSATNRYVVRDGVPVPLPRTTSDFTASPLLSLTGRMRLLKERFVPARPGDPNETVDAFARRRFGDEIAERMFDPLLASMSSGNSDEILARFAFPAMVGHETRGTTALAGSARARMNARRKARGTPTASWSCRNGMADLPATLAAFAGVLVDRAVTAVRRDGSALTCVTTHGDITVDGVVFAVPAHALGSIEIDLPESGRLAGVARIPYASIVAVSLGFPRSAIGASLDGSRLLIPAVERRRLLSAVYPSSIFDHRAPSDHVLITAYLGGARHPELVTQSDEELIRVAVDELSELLSIKAEPVLTHLVRWADALPQAVAGHEERLAAADAVELAATRVAFTGSWRDGLSVSEVLLGGVRAAERLAARLDGEHAARM